MGKKPRVTDAEFEVIEDPRPKRLPFYRRPIPMPFGIYFAMEPVVQWAILALMILLPVLGIVADKADMPLGLKP